MYQKVVWALVGLMALVAGLLLWWVMPDQAWVVRDAQGDWQVAAVGWALLWRGWPLILVGVVIGLIGAGNVLALGLEVTREVDLKTQIVRLTQERDRALADALEHVAVRQRQVTQREAAAVAMQQAMEQACQAAVAAQQAATQAKAEAEQVVTQANFRARNAICAAERIKRRIEGLARFDHRISAP